MSRTCRWRRQWPLGWMRRCPACNTVTTKSDTCYFCKEDNFGPSVSCLPALPCLKKRGLPKQGGLAFGRDFVPEGDCHLASQVSAQKQFYYLLNSNEACSSHDPRPAYPGWCQDSQRCAVLCNMDFPCRLHQELCGLCAGRCKLGVLLRILTENVFRADTFGTIFDSLSQQSLSH